MDRKFGTYVFAGLAIGAFVGALAGAGNHNALSGMGIGALVGVFLGWFVAAAVIEGRRQEDKNTKP